jgi:uncharacterized protein (DUF934 family)
MSALVKLGADGPVLAGALGPGAFRPGPAPRPTPDLAALNGGGGDTRAGIRPNVPQAEEPSVTAWQSGRLWRLDAWLAPERVSQTGLAGLVLMPGEDPLRLEGRLHGLALIAVEFPRFTDGRGLSHATLLRRRLQWRGELRAVGDVLIDQLWSLARCGFDAFALRGDQNPRRALAAFDVFPAVHQEASDGRPFLLRDRDRMTASPSDQRAA